MAPESMSEKGKGPFLAPDDYDDDASSLILSEQDSDSEDDLVVHGAQSSLEVAEHDRQVLEEEEEREKLLVGEPKGVRKLFSLGNTSHTKIGKHHRKKQRRREKREEKEEKRRRQRERRRGGVEEEGELMYELEEGVDTGSSSGDSSIGSEEESYMLKSVYNRNVCIDELPDKTLLTPNSHRNVQDVASLP
jgi:hypothetical protein